MKRRLIMLGVFLLLGAVVNVAVAWIGNWLPDPSSAPYVDDYDGNWPLAVPDHWPRSCGTTVKATILATELSHFEASENWDQEFSIVRFHAGWPMRSVQADDWREIEYRFEEPQQERATPVTLSAGHPEPTFWNRGLSLDTGWGALPIRPLLSGFAINTLFYAAICWMLFAVPGVLRCRRRKRRGRCVHCGYDLRGHAPSESSAPSTACPECGGQLPLPFQGRGPG